MLSSALTHYLHSWMRLASAQPPLLLAGQESQTTKTARFIAQTLLCEAQGSSACTVCTACRQVKAGTHPDFVEYGRDIPHSIKLVRALEEKLSRRPLHGTQVIMLNALEQMSLPAAHALLKTLEEPPATTRFILSTAFPRRLLPTILSRCTRFSVNSELTETTPAQTLPTEEMPTAEELQAVSVYLLEQLKQHGPTPELRRSFQRLRDYHKIRSLKGNEKLAREILVACLQEIRYV